MVTVLSWKRLCWECSGISLHKGGDVFPDRRHFLEKFFVSLSLGSPLILYYDFRIPLMMNSSRLMNIKNSSVQPVGATLAVARPLQGASRQMRATARVAPTPCCPIMYLKFISRGISRYISALLPPAARRAAGGRRGKEEHGFARFPRPEGRGYSS